MNLEQRARNTYEYVIILNEEVYGKKIGVLLDKTKDYDKAKKYSEEGYPYYPDNDAHFFLVKCKVYDKITTIITNYNEVFI